jgi:hypothetical protein
MYCVSKQFLHLFLSLQIRFFRAMFILIGLLIFAFFGLYVVVVHKSIVCYFFIFNFHLGKVSSVPYYVV